MERLLKKWKGVDTQSDESNESDESSENVMRRYYRGQTSTDVLTNIFGQHQGVVSDETFKKMLKRADELVRSGELDNSIYEVLNEFGENTLTSTRGGSSLFRPTVSFSDEGRISFLKAKTQEGLKQKTGLNELRGALFRGNPQVSFYLYEGMPFAYRYTDILPNSGLDEELLQILGDSQGNNLELVPLQEIMQDAKYQPALMDYLRRSHQSTRFQSTQTIPELLEQFSRIQKRKSSIQQQDVDEESQEEQRDMIRRIMRENVRDMSGRNLNMMMQEQVADPWMQM
ncbi:hypothetical protein JTB14_031238 [Gonioctena quinquepunctata]|nr:hypothetical protein JTB14_031238 [Gonioctena quinquepunctata]